MRLFYFILLIGSISLNSISAQVAPKDNEFLVYPDPNGKLKLKTGDKHPVFNGWKFLTSHEFNDNQTLKGQPKGFIEHNTQLVSRMTKINNADCSKVKNGALQIYAKYYQDSIDNGYGKKVTLETAGFRTPKKGDIQIEHWCKFTENMRIEVRMKRTSQVGFNNALWFMGDNDKGWPANGEIDLLENPKKTINHKAHFTLHSENYYTGVVGGAGSVTASIDLEDMTVGIYIGLNGIPIKLLEASMDKYILNI